MFKFNRQFIDYFYKLPNYLETNIVSSIVHDIKYAKLRSDGNRETRYDTIVRVMEGCANIFYDYAAGDINQDHYKGIFEDMAIAMLDGKWLPGGRILRNLNSNIDDIDALKLSNCAALSPDDLKLYDFGVNLYKLQRSQCGVGINIDNWNGKLKHPINAKISNRSEYRIGVKAEDIIYDILYSYTHGSELVKYSGSKTRLRELSDNLCRICDMELRNSDSVRFMADVSNIIGNYVFNKIGRGGQILLGPSDDETFLNLKNYSINSYRESWGYMSNNSVILESDESFHDIYGMCERIKDNGEPGIVNMKNVKKYGRYGETKWIGPDGTAYNMREDGNILVNPCGEIPLESGEVCNLVTINPIRCKDVNEWYKMVEYATLFSTIISLVDCEFELTKEVRERNRRIGVSICGLAEVFEYFPMVNIISYLNNSYDLVRRTNIKLSRLLGINPAKKVTTIKPDGSTSLILGASPGIHNPVYDKYCIRRIFRGKMESYVDKMIEMGIPYEPYESDNNTLVFELPYSSKSRRSVFDLTIWEQFQRSFIVQKFWADNNISTSIYFDPENDKLEQIIPMFIPFLKTVSFLPNDGQSYAQMPYETISKDEYERRVQALLKQ